MSATARPARPGKETPGVLLGVTQDAQDGVPAERGWVVITDSGPFRLESGATLPYVEIAYTAVGPPAAPPVLICHALTGSAHVTGPDRGDGLGKGWWSDLVGPGRAIDTHRYRVIATNTLGGCYGSTGPTAIDPRTGLKYGPDFPQPTIRDQVRAQIAALDRLGVGRLALVAGGSMGGMQALEWALIAPDRVAAVAPLATAARHTAWAVAWSEAARMALLADPEYAAGRYRDQPRAGLAAARAVAMVSYRSRESFEVRFGGRVDGAGEPAVVSWLHHHGDALVRRFDANTYLVLSKAMDTQDVTRGRGELGRVLAGVGVPALLCGIRSDLLYPPSEQREIAAALPRARYVELDSGHGHDGFLIDAAGLDGALRDLLRAATGQPWHW
jgi:homoserine O-acetyltransferase